MATPRRASEELPAFFAELAAWADAAAVPVELVRYGAPGREKPGIIGEDGKVHSIAFRERLESMRLIEEFMIQANVAAAETLEKHRLPPIYRVHDVPSQEKLYAFSDYLRTIGIKFAKGQVVKPGTFNRILAQVKNGPHEAVMNDVVLRSQSQAVYAPDNLGHFGLNLARYAHFTSPIRRYADLLVHRALIRALNLGKDGLTDKETARLGEIAEHISMTERRAMAAERDATARYVAAFLSEHEGAEFDGRITGVTRFGLFVDAAEAEVRAVLDAVALDLLQFHGNETPQYCASFGRPYIKVVRMREGVDLATEVERYCAAQGLLLDTFQPGTPGGTGSAFDWGRVPQGLAKPIILAGGLTADNVAAAVRRVRPYAVDVSGGVEQTKGIKSAAKMAAFIRGVESAQD